MSVAPAAPPAASAETGGAAAFTRQSLAIAAAELRKIARDPTEIFTRAVQPALWLVVLGVRLDWSPGPLLVASNAIYPLEVTPPWLRAVARANPLTYVVDALRGAMIRGGHAVVGSGMHCAVILAAFLVLLAVAARLYPGLAR